MQDALTQREGGTPVYAPPPPPPPPPPPQQAVLPRQQGWWEWLNNLALFPLRFVLHTANEVLQVLGGCGFVKRGRVVTGVCVCVCVCVVQ